MFFVFLLVLTAINAVIVEVKQANKKLNEDMISIYEA